jgi:hypothetical protein
MTYKIISQEDKNTIVEVEINGATHTTLVVCNEGELDGAVEVFIDSIKNPRTFTSQQQPDVQQVIQTQQSMIEALTARLEALESRT